MKKIVEIRNISFSYAGGRKALDSISLDVVEGQIMGMLGPNGSGKSTLFKIISSLIRRYEGSVVIDGLNQQSHLNEVLKKIGVVFQSPSLDKKLTVDENLLYQSALYGINRAQAREKIDLLLESFSISDRRGDYVEKLSGGLARRVEIAKSLIHSPKILVMDEPSTGLDMGARQDLWNLLYSLKNRQSLTILLTTHYAEEADRCDHIVLLDRGKKVCEGRPSELKQKLTFKHFHVKPGNISTAKDFLSNLHVPYQEKDQYLDFQTSGSQQAQDIVLELSKHAQEITFRDPSLEDVYLFHTGRMIKDVQP